MLSNYSYRSYYDKWIWKDIFRHYNTIYVYIPLIKLMKHTHIYIYIYIYTWIELYRPWILQYIYIYYIYIYIILSITIFHGFFLRDRFIFTVSSILYNTAEKNCGTFPGFSWWVSGRCPWNGAFLSHGGYPQIVWVIKSRRRTCNEMWNMHKNAVWNEEMIKSEKIV